MGWVRISDDFPHHPKAVEVGPLGLAMYVAGLCYCNRYLTDGKIPQRAIATLLDFGDHAWDDESGMTDDQFTARIADRLVDAGLWRRNGTKFIVHDYLQYQPSKRQVLADRERDRVKKSRQRRGN